MPDVRLPPWRFKSCQYKNEYEDRERKGERETRAVNRYAGLAVIGTTISFKSSKKELTARF